MIRKKGVQKIAVLNLKFQPSENLVFHTSFLNVVLLNMCSAEALPQSDLFCKAQPCFDRQAEPVMKSST